MPTRDDADKYLDKYFHDRTSGLDANDFLYQVNASRNYDPSPQLEKIKAPVMWKIGRLHLLTPANATFAILPCLAI